MNVIEMSTGSWLGLLGTLGLSLATYLANRYLIPFLQIGKRAEYAGYIARVADDLTDELRHKYPQKQWLAHLDEAIDRLAEICGIKTEIARRAIKAAAGRK